MEFISQDAVIGWYSFVMSNTHCWKLEFISCSTTVISNVCLDLHLPVALKMLRVNSEFLMK